LLGHRTTGAQGYWATGSRNQKRILPLSNCLPVRLSHGLTVPQYICPTEPQTDRATDSLLPAQLSAGNG